MGIKDGYESDDLISVESIDENIIRQEFEEIILGNELINGKTKLAPIEDAEELNEWIVGADDKKCQLYDAEENFDELMVDEGVSATNMK